MANDVAPALLEAIQTDFRRRVKNNAAITRLSNRIRDGTAGQNDVHSYASLLGKMLSESLLAVFTEDALPDGRLYWNIANRTIRPMLKENYRAVNSAAKAVQKVLDTAAGLGLNAVDGEFQEDRIDRLIGGAVEADTFERMQAEIGEPVVNCTESFFDDFVSANADFREKAGFEEIIERTAAANCCEWCAGLVGRYRYGTDIHSGDDVFRRHQFCRCTVTLQTERMAQNPWTKRTWQASPAELERRRETGTSIFRLTPSEAEASVRELLLRDQAVREIMKKKGVDRERASRIYKGTGR